MTSDGVHAGTERNDGRAEIVSPPVKKAFRLLSNGIAPPPLKGLTECRGQSAETGWYRGISVP